MSRLQFQSKITLGSATATGDTTWKIVFTLSDGEGIAASRSVSAGDIIVLNTGLVEPGTFTSYLIQSVDAVSRYGDITATIEYRAINDNATPNPPLDYLVGTDGTVARPTPLRTLLPVVSPGVQGVGEGFAFHVINENLKILDERVSSGVNARLITTPWLMVDGQGAAQLPYEPLGDLVFNMALLALFDGSVVESVGVTIVKDDTADVWYAQVPPEDVAELQGQIGALTVSYLINSDQS